MSNLSEILHNDLIEGRFWTHSRTLVEGCAKISEGCENCWSEAMWFNGGKAFDGRIVLHPERMAVILPKSNRRKPRVWTYWNDLFHLHVSDAFRDDLFLTISQSTDTHIICTKRPSEVVRYLSGSPRHWASLSNVIFLVTMENQKRADERLPWAAQISSAGWKVGALVEPMLTPVDLTGEWGACLYGNGPIRKQWINALSWVICGPENGKGKRPFDGQWAMRLQAQAKAAGIPFCYKGGLLNGKRYIDAP